MPRGRAAASRSSRVPAMGPRLPRMRAEDSRRASESQTVREKEKATSEAPKRAAVKGMIRARPKTLLRPAGPKKEQDARQQAEDGEAHRQRVDVRGVEKKARQGRPDPSAKPPPEANAAQDSAQGSRTYYVRKDLDVGRVGAGGCEAERDGGRIQQGYVPREQQEDQAGGCNGRGRDKCGAPAKFVRRLTRDDPPAQNACAIEAQGACGGCDPNPLIDDQRDYVDGEHHYGKGLQHPDNEQHPEG